MEIGHKNRFQITSGLITRRKLRKYKPHLYLTRSKFLTGRKIRALKVSRTVMFVRRSWFITFYGTAVIFILILLIEKRIRGPQTQCMNYIIRVYSVNIGGSCVCRWCTFLYHFHWHYATFIREKNRLLSLSYLIARHRLGKEGSYRASDQVSFDEIRFRWGEVFLYERAVTAFDCLPSYGIK